ncbi:fucose mutarotase isoform X5 [Crocuta crocuta]
MVVLKGVPALLSPELLYALARMGHGDEIVLADVNFPTSSICRCGPEEIRADAPGSRAKAAAPGHLRGDPGCCHGPGAQRQDKGPSDSGVEELPVHPVRGRLHEHPGEDREV